MANVQKRVLYVGTGFTVYTACRAALMASLRRAGGLEEGVTKEILHAAFIPFGELLDVQVPQDHATQKNRGFGFVEFEDAEDAKAAMDNMNRAELYGRVLTVNVAKPMKPTSFNKPVWAEADEWWKKTLEERGTDFETNEASDADMVPRGATE